MVSYLSRFNPSQVVHFVKLAAYVKMKLMKINMSRVFFMSGFLGFGLLGCNANPTTTTTTVNSVPTMRNPAQVSAAKTTPLGVIQTGYVTRIDDQQTGYTCYVASNAGNIAMQCFR